MHKAIWVCLAMWISAACSACGAGGVVRREAAASPSKVGKIALVHKERGITRRVVLFSGGVGRTDVVTGFSRTRAFVIPVDEEAFLRVWRVAGAVVELGKRLTGERSGAEDRVFLRVDDHGREKSVAVRVGRGGGVEDWLWRGVAEQIAFTGCAGLAEALATRAGAEEEAGRGSLQNAVDSYQRAVQGLYEWQHARARLNGVIYEPEITMRFKFRTEAGQERDIWGIPDKKTEIPGMNVETKLAMFRYIWKELSEEIQVTMDEGMAVVRFDPKFAELFGLSGRRVESGGVKAAMRYRFLSDPEE